MVSVLSEQNNTVWLVRCGTQVTTPANKAQSSRKSIEGLNFSKNLTSYYACIHAPTWNSHALHPKLMFPEASANSSSVWLLWTEGWVMGFQPLK